MRKVIWALIVISAATYAYASPNSEACNNAFHASMVAMKEGKTLNAEFRQIVLNNPKPFSAAVIRQLLEVTDKQLSYAHQDLGASTYLRDHYECTLGDTTGGLGMIITEITNTEKLITGLNETRSMLTGANAQ